MLLCLARDGRARGPHSIRSSLPKCATVLSLSLFRPLSVDMPCSHARSREPQQWQRDHGPGRQGAAGGRRGGWRHGWREGQLCRAPCNGKHFLAVCFVLHAVAHMAKRISLAAGHPHMRMHIGDSRRCKRTIGGCRRPTYRRQCAYRPMAAAPPRARSRAKQHRGRRSG